MDEDLVMPDDFQETALAYQPPGLGVPASSVSAGEPSAEPWPPAQGDALGPPAQLAAPPPVVSPGVAPAATPTHAQQVQTVRQVISAPGEAEAIERARRSAGEAALAQGEADRLKAEGRDVTAQAKDDEAVQMRLDEQEAEDKRAALEAREAEARAKMDAAEQDLAGTKFHEYGKDQFLGDRIIGKIARAFGTFNLSGNYSHNEAAEKLDRDILRDFDKQKLDLMSKENIAKWRRAGVTDASAQMKEEMGALYARQAKLHEAVAAKAEAMAIRAGVPAEEAQANAIVKKQIAMAGEAKAKALAAFRGSVTTQYGVAKAGKGGGGGGGGGSGANIAKFVDAVNALKPGDKVTPEVYELGRKAGYKANQIGTEVDRIRTTGAKSTTAEGRAGKVGEEEVKDVDRRAEATKRELYNPRGPGTQYNRLKSMGNLLEHAIASGDKTAATSVLEEAGGMLSGGKSTRNTVELLKELKSTRDELTEKWGHLAGDPGASAAYTKRLKDLLGRVRQEKLDEIKQVREQYVQTELGPNGLAREGKRKERVLGHAAMFGDANGSGGTPVSAGGIPAGAILGKDASGRRGYAINGEFHAL